MKKHPKALLEVAFDAEGVSPKDIDVRQLAKLLTATAELIEAVAVSRDLDVPSVRLTEVRDGSAAYRLSSEAPSAEPTVRHLYDVAKARAQDETEEVRQAYARVVSSGDGLPVRLAPRAKTLPRRPILLAPLAPRTKTELVIADQVYGKLTGLQIRGEHLRVTIKGDGRAEDFVAGDDQATLVRMFGKNVRALVSRRHFAGSVGGRTLENAWPFDTSDQLGVLVPQVQPTLPLPATPSKRAKPGND